MGHSHQQVSVFNDGEFSTHFLSILPKDTCFRSHAIFMGVLEQGLQAIYSGAITRNMTPLSWNFPSSAARHLAEYGILCYEIQCNFIPIGKTLPSPQSDEFSSHFYNLRHNSFYLYLLYE